MGEEELVLPSFYYGTNEQMVDAEHVEGAFHVTIDDPQLYLDLNNTRMILSGGVILDDELSDTSIHPVQNNVIKAALDTKAAKDIVCVQSTQPTSDTCLIWIKTS